QGALEGVMIDAIAAASNVPVADVRRAAMFVGDLGLVARVALTEGADALARYAVALHRPVQPMLAQPADDIADALARLGTAARACAPRCRLRCISSIACTSTARRSLTVRRASASMRSRPRCQRRS